MSGTSGTPAATLAIVVKANTAAATAGLSKVEAQGRAVAATSGAVTKSTSRTSSAMRKLGTAAKYGGAALGVAFVVEAKRAVTTTQELTKSTISLHKNLGLSNKQASEWAGLAKARGVDSTKLGMAFKTLATQITSARDGSATAVTMFKRLGFSQKDIAKGAQDTEFAVKKVSDGIKNLGAGADRTAIQGKLFGRGWQTIAPIMRDGSKAMQEQLDTVEKYGGVLQGKTLKQQEKLLQNIRENKIAWQGFQIQLANFVTPALNKVSDQFQRIAAIQADKDLTGAEKWAQISHNINDDLNRALSFLTDHLIPELAKRMGEAGPKIAGALLKSLWSAFTKSDILGKLFIAATFIRLIGGKGALFKIGASIAGYIFGPIFAAQAAEGLATTTKSAPVATASKGLGTTMGRLAQTGFAAALVVGLAGAIESEGGIGTLHFDGLIPKTDTAKFKFASSLLGKETEKLKHHFGSLGYAIKHMSETGTFKLLELARASVKDGDMSRLAFYKLQARIQRLQGTLKPLVTAWRNSLKRLADTAATGKEKVQAAFGKQSEWAGFFNAPLKGINGDWRKAFKRLADTAATGAQKVRAAFGPGSPWADFLKGFDKFKAMTGGGGGKGGGKAKPGTLGAIFQGHGAEHGGYVTSQGIIPVGFQAGGMVGRHGARPGSRDTVPALLEPGELIIPRRIVEDTRKNAKLAAVAMTGELGKGTKGALKNAVEFVKKHGVSMKQMKDTAGKLTQGFRKTSIDDFTKTKQQGSQQTDQLKQRATEDFNRLHSNVTQQMNKTRDQSVKASKDTAKGVGKNYNNMVGAVQNGLGQLASMTNRALKALGVDRVDFGIKTQKPKGHQRGGHINSPTAPSSGDHIPAMLEKNEYVLNREAVRKVGKRNLDALNFGAARRFAKGGLAGGLDFALGPYTVPPIQYDPDHAGGNSHVHVSANSIPWLLEIGHKIQQLGNSVGEFQPTRYGNPYHFGPVTTSAHAHYTHDHYSGFAFDVNSLRGAETKGWEQQIANVLGGKVGAMVEQIKKVILTGPDGPLKDMGQAALDKVRAAANAKIAKAQARSGAGGSVEVGPGMLSLPDLGRLTKGHGMPAIMSYVAWNESGGDPNAHNASGASGLWQILLPLNQRVVHGNVFDPNVNANAAKALYDEGGLSPWEASRNAGAHGGWGQDVGKGWPMRLGGLVGLKGGGDPKGKNQQVTGKDVKAGLDKLSAKNLFGLMGDLTKGPGAVHEGMAAKVSKILLKKIADVRKGTPVKPKGHLHDYLNELDILLLKLKLHKKGKPHDKARGDLYDWLGDPEDGFYTWQTLRNRKAKWGRLQIKRDIAAKTPNPKDDIRIAKIIADFTGKSAKPGAAADDIARTQQLFDFLALLGPTTGLTAFAKGGTLGAGRIGIAGEAGPELVRGPATIHSAADTASILKPSFDLRIYIGDREITDIVRVELKEKDRHASRVDRAGMGPAR